jgi:D-alanine transaminase
MPALACLNGTFTDPDEARVPIWDRGFLFGDGVYDVWRIYNRKLWLDDSHLNRLRRSLREIAIEGVDVPALHARMHETIERAAIHEAVIYVQITRGVALRKHAFPRPPATPTELIVVLPYDDEPTALLREAGISVVSHADLRWKRCDIKSVNLLANVLANEAAHAEGAYEAILVDGRGQVTEATHSSLLWVHEGALYGSPEGPEILPGTTRHLICELAQACELPFHEAEISLEALKSMDEVLLSGTTIEVMPVIRIDTQAVANDKPGPVTRALQAAFRARLTRWLAQ